MKLWACASLLCGLVALAAAAGPAPARPTATASRTQTEVTTSVSGSLALTWTADSARGCASVGLCGVSGSLQMSVSGGFGEASSGLLSPASVPIELQDGSATARVLTQSANGAVVSSCADLVPVDFSLTVRSTAAGLRAVADRAQTFQAPSAGHCAGPTSTDLEGLALPARRVGAGGYDLTGTTTYGAGPFTITAVSAVRAHATVRTGATVGLAGGSGGSAPVVRRRTVLQEQATVEYRVTGVTGSLVTDFSGLPAPFCAAFGACGSSGALRQSFSTPSGSLGFTGTRDVTRPVREATALADLRAGRLGGGTSGGIPALTGTVGELFSAPGETPCSDTQSGPMQLAAMNLGRREDFQVVLDAGAAGGFPDGGLDALRTRCPGPTASDVVSARAGGLAAVTLAAQRIGAPRLALTFAPRGSFTGTAYTGTRTGSVVLSLVRERETGGTRRVQMLSIVRSAVTRR
jgi:hypothetical protein